MASVILHADFESCEQQVAALSPLTGFGISLLVSVCNQDCSGGEGLEVLEGAGHRIEKGWEEERERLQETVLLWRLILGDHVSINAAFMKSNFSRWEEQDWFFLNWGYRAIIKYNVFMWVFFFVKLKTLISMMINSKWIMKSNLIVSHNKKKISFQPCELLAARGNHKHNTSLPRQRMAALSKGSIAP